MHAFLADLVYAARTFRKKPAFAITAIATLALGIGSTAAIFSVVNAVLLQPLPYDEPASAGPRLARPAEPQRHAVSVGAGRLPRSAHAGDDVQGSRRADDRAAGDRGRGRSGRSRTGSDRQRHAQPLSGCSARASRTAAISPTPTARHRRPAGCGSRCGGRRRTRPPPPPPQAILSHEFWQRHFGANPATSSASVVALGQQRLDVVGVLEPGFEMLFPPGMNIERAPDIWTPMRVNFAAGSRVNVAQRVIGRLAVMASPSHGRRKKSTDRRRPARAVSDQEDRRFLPAAGADAPGPRRRRAAGDPALMGAVCFVMLIACANVANLLLVRAAARERELAVRAALGGSRARLIRQLLVESLLLAGLAAVSGILLARFGIDLLIAVGPENLPRMDRVDDRLRQSWRSRPSRRWCRRWCSGSCRRSARRGRT